MIKAVLFDLDGTLLINDLDLFMKNYFSLLREDFKKIGDEKELFKNLNIAIEKMLLNKGPKTNYEVFWDEFTKLTGKDRKNMEEFFNNFYSQKFPLLKDLSQARTNFYAKEVIERSFELGLKVVIATNAVFPIIAIEERLRWGELQNYPYDLITSMEKMHSCKPNVEYYKEILEKINVPPERAIMVGNDIKEDLSASKLGILTFLYNHENIFLNNIEYKPDFIGTLKDFFEILPLLAK
ncbi:HAD family hydrolase [Dictyoglomus thermophilum]|uniref:Haloacid dehalogenase domain protein n=1 Tax=Dictyoglomus thermophilum (strain ATCC 35947 / DSM 3960 / H-6-12) TaxID=309799 RepID=B5YAC7_DICT6|nr:HAD family hydrolase [Dictyoglomus thermophilum]ACI20057.1 haloacid dehalogenase domain protein [Dictyoglomus thermophilum H-6-12]